MPRGGLKDADEAELWGEVGKLRNILAKCDLRQLDDVSSGQRPDRESPPKTHAHERAEINHAPHVGQAIYLDLKPKVFGSLTWLLFGSQT